MVVPFSTSTDVEAAFPTVAGHLEAGGLIAYPTETVYGLGCLIREASLATLSELTGRPSDKPFILLVAGMEMASGSGLVFTEAATRIAESFWPGPVTLVLEDKMSVFPGAVRGTGGGVAVRQSPHPAAGRLVEELGVPITSTSANLPGEQPLPGAAEIAQVFKRSIQEGSLLVLDGGALGANPSSTLVDCTSPVPRILREGAVSATHLMACIREVSG